MSKWKCEICNSSFENFDARGFDNKIYCPLCYYKKLYKDTELERERLQKLLNIEKEKREQFDKDNHRRHSIIKEVREYAKEMQVYCIEFESWGVPSKELLQIIDRINNAN